MRIIIKRRDGCCCKKYNNYTATSSISLISIRSLPPPMLTLFRITKPTSAVDFTCVPPHGTLEKPSISQYRLWFSTSEKPVLIGSSRVRMRPESVSECCRNTHTLLQNGGCLPITPFINGKCSKLLES